MGKKLKLMTILGTRPEIIRLTQLLKLCDKVFDHQIIHTGQNWDYTLNEVFFNDLELRKPDFNLDCVGKHLGETIGNIIAKSYELLKQENPDAVLILGDTNSALAAISAKRLKVPIFHMEAGNRCWDWNVPEMINRKIVDHISDINLPYTEHSRRYLLSEGIDGKTIFVTGSPMSELIAFYKEKILDSQVLADHGLERSRYILLSAHREENIDIEENFLSLMTSINHVAEYFQMPVIFSCHPRSRNIIKQKKFVFHSSVRSSEPFGYFDYNKLQMNAFCVLSDSGTLSEESAILGFPGVLIRTSTERPEVLDAGTIVVGGISSEAIIQAVEASVFLHKNTTNVNQPSDYQDLNVSSKVVKIIQSYAKIVNITTWQK